MSIQRLKEEVAWFRNHYLQLKAREKMLESPFAKVESDLTNCLACLCDEFAYDVRMITETNYEKYKKKWEDNDELYCQLRSQAQKMGWEFQSAFYNECLKYTGRANLAFRR